MDTGALNIIAHELGHALDAKLLFFPQQKKKPNFQDILIEVPSTCLEVLFDDYIVDKHIDVVGGIVLKNHKAESLRHYSTLIHKSLEYESYYYDSEGNIIDLKTYKGYDSFRYCLLYGLGYEFAYHMLLIARQDKNEFKRLFNNLITSRMECDKLTDSIKKIGYDPEDFIKGKYIKDTLEDEMKSLIKIMQK